jgi:amidophosphoribosyltransferase
MGDVEHNCGICVGRSLHDTYNFLGSLQHRGRDAAGIFGVRNDGRIDVLKWIGEVESFDRQDLHLIFDGNYHTFGGHVRYATKGKDKKNLLNSAHPIIIGGKEESRGNHIIARDCNAAIIHNGHVSDNYFGNLNIERLISGTDSEKLLNLYYNSGIGSIVKNIPGSYTMVIADKRNRDIIAVRDKTGIRPGFIGFKDQKHVLASEDVALVRNGATVIEEMKPGSAYYFSPDGNKSVMNIGKPFEKKCFFEWNYIANVGSTLSGVSVRELRSKLGEKLAEEFEDEVQDADYVSYLPRCPEPASRSFEAVTGIEFLPVFYKRRARRAFQGPDAKERSNSIKENLYLRPGIKESIRGKKLVLIDDSTIRGNNSKHARELLYEEAEVREALLLNYTSKIGIIGDDNIPRGCEFGVDMPPEENENHWFIARGRNDEEISEEIGMPVRFLSLDGMLEVFENFGIKKESLCTYCVGGEHPFKNFERNIEVFV